MVALLEMVTAVVLVLPALAFLYILTQRSMLEGEFREAHPDRRRLIVRSTL